MKLKTNFKQTHEEQYVDPALNEFYEYVVKRHESLLQNILKEVQSEIKADISEGSLFKALNPSFDLIKGWEPGQQKKDHKYIRREGSPGSYVYIYADDLGQQYRASQAPEEHPDFVPHPEGFKVWKPEPHPVFEHEDKIRAQLKEKGFVASRPRIDQTPQEQANWAKLKSEFKNSHVWREDGSVVIYRTETEKKQATYYQEHITPFNKPMAKHAEEVNRKWLAGDFKLIDKGVGGKKGFVTTDDGTTYFVKSSEGAESIHANDPVGKKNLINNNEVDYQRFLNEAFPEFDKFQPPKLKLSDTTFMQEVVKMKELKDFRNSTELSNYLHRNKKDIAKLAFVNYILGNGDRHGSNVMFSPEDGVKIIDEGLSFQPLGHNLRAPAYVLAAPSHNLAKSDLEDLKKTFNPEKLNQLRSMVEKYRPKWVSEKDSKAIEHRMNRVQQFLNLDRLSFHDISYELFQQKWYDNLFKERQALEDEEIRRDLGVTAKVDDNAINKIMKRWGVK